MMMQLDMVLMMMQLDMVLMMMQLDMVLHRADAAADENDKT